MSMKYKFEDKVRYDNKTRFLNAVSGQKICDEQSVINTDPNMAMIASQIETSGIKVPSKEEGKPSTRLYDCWLYYCVKKEVQPQQFVKPQIVPQVQPLMPQPVQMNQPMAQPQIPQMPQPQQPQPVGVPIGIPQMPQNTAPINVGQPQL